MNYTHRIVYIAVICVATTSPWFVVTTQARQAGVLYEEGVNAYFSGRACEAESYLSLAINENSQDPRAYYFRALSLLRQGRIDLAQGDMLTGAMLEAQQPHRYSIGSALERVQGPHRLMLEEFRRSARLNASLDSSSPATMPAQAPNRTFREGESNVLRERTFVPLEELLRPEGPRTIAVEPTPEPAPAKPAVPPQGGTPAATPSTPTTPPQPTPAPKENDPFADDTDRAAPSAAPAPTPPIPPQKAPKPTTPPAAQDEDPFGG